MQMIFQKVFQFKTGAVIKLPDYQFLILNFYI